MTDDELLLEIEESAQEIGLHIRYEKGDFDGGYCILRDENIIVVNRKLAPAKKCSVIAQALNEFGIGDLYLKPIVRTYIEDEMVRVQAQASKNVIKMRNSEQVSETPAEQVGEGDSEPPVEQA